MKSPSVAIVTTHPIQYQVPLFQKLAREVDLSVVFMMEAKARDQAEAGFGVEFDWDIPLLEGYSYQFAKNISSHPSPSRRKGIILEDPARLLEDLAPEIAVVMGWYPQGYIQIINEAQRRKIPLLCRGENNLLQSVPFWKKIARQVYYRLLFRKVQGFLTIGQRNRDFYRHFGVPPSRLHFAPYSVDTEFFEREFARHKNGGKDEEDEKVCTFGFAGKFISRKRPLDILYALKDSPIKEKVELVYIGDGPLASQLKEKAENFGIRADFRGFLNQSEIVKKGYSDLDCLILPSEAETWGLVVNEVMTGGVPAIVSHMVGCCPDLIFPGKTGFVFKKGNPADLRRKMEDFYHLYEKGQSLAPEVKEKMEDYSLEKTVEGFLEAFEKVIEKR